MRMAEGARRYFASRAGKAQIAFSEAVSKAFTVYPWPGNLREMRNVIERAVILAPGDTIELADLPEGFSGTDTPTVAVGARVTLDALEAEHIRRIVATCRNLEDAAHTLGIDPATLYRKRVKLGLH
jgi:NtrC-family two-component system response regulator AlgB